MMSNVFEAMLRSMGECAIFDWGTWSQRDMRDGSDRTDRAAPADEPASGDVIVGRGESGEREQPDGVSTMGSGAYAKGNSEGTANCDKSEASAGRRVSFSDAEPKVMGMSKSERKQRTTVTSPLEFRDAEPGPNVFLVLSLAGLAAVIFAEVVRMGPRFVASGFTSGDLLSPFSEELIVAIFVALARCVRAGVASAPAAAACVFAALLARLLQRAMETRGSRRCPPMKGWGEHAIHVDAVRADFAAFLEHKGPGDKLSILRSRRGTNPSNRTTEAKYKERATPLDVSRLCEVIDIDKERMLIHVEPGAAMDFMARLAMAHGVVPQVVLEFPGITVGGAVCGGGIESSSHIFGSFVDTVEEMDVITGNGEFHRGVTRESDPDLFFALSTSFGTIGIITRVAVRVIPSAPFVHVRYMHCDGIRSATEVMERMANCTDGSGGGGGHGAPDFIDAVALAPGSAMIVCGTLATEPPPGVQYKSLRSKRWDEWFFWHLTSLSRKMATVTVEGDDGLPTAPPTPPAAPPLQRYYDNFIGHEEYMPLEDFLFRFDRGAFWMARPGLELFYGKLAYNDDPRAAPGPHFLLRIKYAWLCTTRQLYRMLHRCGDDLVARMFLVQDFIMPSKREACELVDFSNEKTGIWPIWICPVRVINRDIHRTNACFGFPWQSSPHRSLMFNVGVYGTPHGGTAAYDPVDLNREVEGFVSGLGGRKMLYAQTFYTLDEFWKLFDERAYQLGRSMYDREGVFPEVVEKLLFGSDRMDALRGAKRVSFTACWGKMLQWYLSLWQELVVPAVFHEAFGLDHTDTSLFELGERKPKSA